MKKKIAVLLSLFLTLTVFLTGCGNKDQSEMDFNGKSFLQLQNEMLENYIAVNVYVNVGATYAAQTGLEFDDTTVDEAFASLGYEEAEVFAMYGVNYNEADKKAAKALYEVITTYGTPKQDYDFEGTFKVVVSGKTTTTDTTFLFVNAAGEEKEVTFELVYDTWNMELTGITIEPVKTLGEKMANAGLNTLISMAIVFMVLILISLLIYAFNIFPYIENKRKEKAKKDAAKDAANAPVVAVEETTAPTDVTDDYELVAVIAAAIAASEGCETSDFVVRSINRR